MELLSTYSSDSSDNEQNDALETDKSTEDENKAPSIDYFNLQENATNSTAVANPESDKFLDSYNLVMQAQILTTESYGPSEFSWVGRTSKQIPNLKTGDTESSFKFTKREYSVFENHEAYVHPSKLQKTDENEKNNLNLDSSAEFKLVNNTESRNVNNSVHSYQVLSVPAEGSMYYVDRRISELLTCEAYCRIPQHQVKSYSAHMSPVSALSWCVPQYSHLFLSASLDSTVKVWDKNYSKCVLKITNNGGIKSAKWSLSGTKIFYGGFDKEIHVLDLNAGQTTFVCSIEDYVSSIQMHPKLTSIILVGTNNKIMAFDERASALPVRSYIAKCQHVLDMAFINDQEFVCSTEVVSHDSSDRTLMVWDFSSGAVMSNQIYSERYTCPCVAVEPGGKYFAAQSNGDYIVMFFTKRPYKMLNKRYANHKVSGYNIGCDFSKDGSFLASGDANGTLCIYSSCENYLLKKIDVKPGIPTVRINWHPVLPSTIATAGWDGSVQIWQ